jgi:hypothetical protein
LSVEASLAACGIRVRRPQPEELPFQFDELLRQAWQAEADGDWPLAARAYEYLAAHHRNELWMKSLAAGAHFHAGHHAQAARLSRQVNQVRSTVETLLLEARVCRRKRNFTDAIGLLEQAERGLQGHLPIPARTPMSQRKGAVTGETQMATAPKERGRRNTPRDPARMTCCASWATATRRWQYAQPSAARESGVVRAG